MPPQLAAAAPPARSAVLDGIQKAGGIGSLKKVDRTQIRDRSSAQVGGAAAADTGPHGSGLPPAGVAPGAGGGGGMADALAAALQKRKEKVSRSGESSPSLFPPCLAIGLFSSLVVYFLLLTRFSN